MFHVRIFLLSSFGFLAVAQQNQQKTLVPPTLAAEFEETHTRQLTDGNTVVNRVTGQFFRDNQGRTRLERGNVVIIKDPVAQTLVVLNASSQSARRFSMVRNTQAFDGTASPGTGITGGQQVDLGTQLMEGEEVKGKQFSLVVPAGAIGNKQPIQQVSEMWRSDKLLLLLLVKSKDTLNGERIQRYHNIRAGVDVDPALFTIPKGFQVVDVNT